MDSINVAAESLIERNLENINRDSQVEKEDRLLYRSDRSSLSEHNRQYTTLLKAYVNDFIENSEAKRNNKEIMFRIAKRLLFWVPVTTIVLMFACLIFLSFGQVTVVEILPELISALTTLLGTLMVVPKMITKYLFNKKEEDHLAEVIGKLQDYDRDIRGNL